MFFQREVHPVRLHALGLLHEVRGDDSGLHEQGRQGQDLEREAGGMAAALLEGRGGEAVPNPKSQNYRFGEFQNLRTTRIPRFHIKQKFS